MIFTPLLLQFPHIFANISMGEKCLGGCLEKIFQFQRQFCEKRLTLEVWSCQVYNISNSSASLHLCPLTWSVLSWSLRSLSLSPGQIRKYTPQRKGKSKQFRALLSRNSICNDAMTCFHDMIKVLKSNSKKGAHC